MSEREGLSAIITDIENKKDFHKTISNVLAAIIIGLSLNVVIYQDISGAGLQLVLLFGFYFVFPFILYSYLRFIEYNHAVRAMNNLFFEFDNLTNKEYSFLSSIIDVWLSSVIIRFLIKMPIRLYRYIRTRKGFILFASFIVIRFLIDQYLETIEISSLKVGDTINSILFIIQLLVSLWIYQIIYNDHEVRIDIMSLSSGLVTFNKLNNPNKDTLRFFIKNVVLQMFLDSFDKAKMYEDEKTKEKLFTELAELKFTKWFSVFTDSSKIYDDGRGYVQIVEAFLSSFERGFSKILTDKMSIPQ